MDAQPLRREDIIGHVIVEILAHSMFDDEELDYCDCLFVLESGLVFRIPSFSDEPFLPSVRPSGALPVESRYLNGVLEATIVQLLRPELDDEFYPGTAILGLNTGRWICHVLTAPHGLGATGIHISEGRNIDFDEMVDYWSRGKIISPNSNADSASVEA